jgi:hypothetical protein
LNLSSNFEFGPVGNRSERSGPVGPVPTVSGLVPTGSVNPAPVRPDHWSVGASETDVVCISSQGTRRFSFLGAFAQLSASTFLLRRQHQTSCSDFSATTMTTLWLTPCPPTLPEMLGITYISHLNLCVVILVFLFFFLFICMYRNLFSS